MTRFAWLGIVLCVLHLPGCSQRERTAAAAATTVDLSERLSSAKVETTGIGKVDRLEFAVGGETRRVLFMHPPSRVTFGGLRIVPGTHLKVGLGINQLAWDKPGDGVQFLVTATGGARKDVVVLSRYVNPKGVPADRHWIDFDIPLDAVAGADMSLTFATTPGPVGDVSFDWSGWSRPILATPE